MIHDTALRSCVSDWIISLDEETFIESLPLFRRVFSDLDKVQRQHLLSAALGKEVAQSAFEVIKDFEQLWPEHMQHVVHILSGKRQMSELQRRWQMMLGGESSGLSERDGRISSALDELYDPGSGSDGPKSKRGGLGRSAPRVAKWMGDVRECFPASVVQIIQRDAFTRLGLQQMLLEPEFLAAMQADVNLVADLMSLQGMMPEKTKQTAREVIQKVVNELMKRLERKTSEALRGALDRSKRTNRPRASDIDWPRTIRANLHQYLHEYKTVIPDRLLASRANSAD